MIGFLTRHEWRVLTTSEVVQIVVAVFGAALVFASLLGITRLQREQRAIEKCECAAGSMTPPRSLRADVIANDIGLTVLMPRAPLATLAAGQSDVYPSYLKVTARRADALVTGDQVEHPLGLAAGHFDVAFVVLFLYPLLIFAVSFDLTASERDRGTLRMVLSQPITLGALVTGKMIARALLLGVPVVLIPLLASLGAPPLLVAAWTLTVMAYGTIWHGIALIVNARGWNAATNALVLAGIWLLFAVIGPATINLLIELAYPMPSRVEAAVQARAATQDATVQGSRQLGQFLQDHPTSANIGRDGMRQFAQLQAARDRQIADRMQEVGRSFERQLERQRRLATWLSALSPTMVAQQVLLEAAGTGTSRFEWFETSARTFQEQWRAYFEPKVLDAATLTEAEVAAAPRFTFAEPTAAAVVRTVMWPMVGMAIVGAVLVVVGMRGYRRYAV